jgi:cyclopropane fatty-acyl-phospholipid synthase-like methyltransferase
VTDFAAVDTGDARQLVAMMDATDAWPAVQATRAWLLEQVELADDAVVLDAGCGPGTFGGSAARHGDDHRVGSRRSRPARRPAGAPAALDRGRTRRRHRRRCGPRTVR